MKHTEVKMNKKQTAVEWLGYELNTKLFYDITPELWEQVNEIFKQSLQMEREEIEDAYIDGQTISDGYQGKSDYYNKTYGQDENRNYSR